MTSEDLLDATGLVKTFQVQHRGLWRSSAETMRALDDVSLSVAPHESVAIVGESGSGKSTLARVLMRLLDPDEGSVFFGGEDILAMPSADLRRVRPRFQMVFQNPYGSLNPRLPVGRSVVEAAVVHDKLRNQSAEALSESLLSRVGLSPKLASRLPRELSGGQRQRVAIARALSVEPELLIADEAVSALDLPVQAQILNLLESLRSQLGIALIFISHQLPVVSHVADRVMVMYLGRVVEEGPIEDVFQAPAHPYTASLLAAQPGRHRHRAVGGIAGATSTVTTSVFELQQTGCAFRDRCPRAMKTCADIRPALATVGDRHAVACHLPAS